LDWELLAEGKSLDQVSRDYETGATFRMGKFSLEDRFSYRTFKDKARIKAEFGSFSLAPKFDKYQNNFSFSLILPYYTNFYTNYTYYLVDSEGFREVFGRESQIKYHNIQIRFSNNSFKNLNLSLFYRYQDLTNNDVYTGSDLGLFSVMGRKVNTLFLTLPIV
jgi:hypothetical protein